MRPEKTVAILAALAAAGMAISAQAAVIRKLPAMDVVESETLSVDSMKATAVRSSNPAVFTASLHEAGEAVINGVRIGEGVLAYVNERGEFANRPVKVVPAYWGVLKGMFSEDPEITVSIVGDKVVVSGATANVDTLRRVEQIKAMDSGRIVTQVTYSTAQIGELVKGFLARSNFTNINVNVVGHEVCLSGRMYDTQSIEQLKKRVGGFVHDFPGIVVNTDELRVLKQKIVIGIEFVAYNDNQARKLGIDWPQAITAGLDWNFGYTHDKHTGGSYSSDSTHGYSGTGASSVANDGTTPKFTSSSDESLSLARNKTSTKNNDWQHNWSGGANARVDGVQATINMLKSNGAAKRLYTTTLSTQSGIEAEFQNGGTVYVATSDLYKTDTKEIEYGYIIKATPLIIDENTINLDFDLNLKQDLGRPDNTDYKVSRYQTKSKYLVRPGESIILSGYKYSAESEAKKGTPWFSKIPWLGDYLFGSNDTSVDMDEMLLVVTVNWALEDDASTARTLVDEMKDRKVEVEMP